MTEQILKFVFLYFDVKYETIYNFWIYVEVLNILYSILILK